MKKVRKNTPASSAAAQSVPVRLDFTHSTATRVCVAGTFNQWEPEVAKLDPAGTGLWWKEIALAPGTHEYCFIVDGQWIADPQAADYVPNPFGGRNSVLTVAQAT